MISFRYHIISIVGIFLALGLGMLIGAGVLTHVTVAQLEGRVSALRSDLSSDRASITQLRASDQQKDALLKSIAPRVTNNVLQSRQVLFVRSRGGQDWEGPIVDAMKSAGASDVGMITFTSRWTLGDPKDADRLAAALQTQLDASDPSGSAAAYLASKLSAADGPALVEALRSAGFLDVTTPASGSFPPPGADIVVFASPTDEPWLDRFAQAVSVQASTLVAAPTIDALGAVDTVRHLPSPSKLLSTFDSAAIDPAGVGCVLALRAAIDQQGANFGTASGLSYVQPSSS